MDFQASHDLEDFVAVIEGRDTLLQEMASSLSRTLVTRDLSSSSRADRRDSGLLFVHTLCTTESGSEVSVPGRRAGAPVIPRL
jgi:hypothetical protein